jgi:hypothetical protein
MALFVPRLNSQNLELPVKVVGRPQTAFGVCLIPSLGTTMPLYGVLRPAHNSSMRYPITQAPADASASPETCLLRNECGRLILKSSVSNPLPKTTYRQKLPMATSKKKTSVPPDKLELYDKLVAATPGIESKSNFGAAYTSINGNMYSMISKHGVVGIRLPEEERLAFLEKYKTAIFRADPAWPPNPEYVAVPDALLSKTATLSRYLKISFDYASTLRPRPTSKKK